MFIVRTGATGASAPVNFWQRVLCTRPEKIFHEVTYKKQWIFHQKNWQNLGHNFTKIIRFNTITLLKRVLIVQFFWGDKGNYPVLKTLAPVLREPSRRPCMEDKTGCWLWCGKYLLTFCIYTEKNDDLRPCSQTEVDRWKTRLFPLCDAAFWCQNQS